MKNILVTGGAGFIGSNFIRYLIHTNPELYIINLDALTYAGNLDNLADLSPTDHYKFVMGDISNQTTVMGTVRVNHIDTIINFAAESHVDRSVDYRSRVFVKTNVVGVGVLLNIALKVGIEKFIQIGTDEVYGSLEEESPSSVETDVLNPRSPYAATKASADLLALSYYHTHGLPMCITRSSNNYGAYQYPEKIIPLFITNILRGKKVPLYGDGRNIRDWLHVEDNCEGIAQVLWHGRPGEIYNIAGGNEVRNIDLTYRILEIMGMDCYDAHINRVTDRKGHDWRYSMNCTKIKRELDWEPRRGFDEGLVKTVRWYKDNEAWWKKLI